MGVKGLRVATVMASLAAGAILHTIGAPLPWMIGPLLAQDWVAYLFSYGGLALDLLIVPALLLASTLYLSYLAAIAFATAPWKVYAASVIAGFLARDSVSTSPRQ